MKPETPTSRAKVAPLVEGYGLIDRSNRRRISVEADDCRNGLLPAARRRGFALR